MRFEKRTTEIELNEISEKLMSSYLSIDGGRSNVGRQRQIPEMGSFIRKSEVIDMVVDEDRSHDSYDNKGNAAEAKAASVRESNHHALKLNRSNSLPVGDNNLIVAPGAKCSEGVPGTGKYAGKGLNLLSNNYNRRKAKDSTGRTEYRHSGRDVSADEGTHKKTDAIKETETGYKMYNTAVDIVNSTEAYAKLLVNIILVFTTLYILFGVIFVIKNDIESKIQISTTNIIEEMNMCSRQYVDNKCQPDSRVPAMELKCNEWERCMSQNPTIIARKSIFTAQIIGEILNTFFDQISFKSALFIFGLIIALVIGNFFLIKTSIDKTHVFRVDHGKRELKHGNQGSREIVPGNDGKNIIGSSYSH